MSKEVSITTIDTSSLCTTGRKGDRVSFERSIAFASKDARELLSANVYARQIDNGVYGPLFRDALAAGILGKASREIVETMMAGMGRNPSKASAATLCAVLLAAWSGKEPKGQKAFYVRLVGRLARHIADAVEQPAGEVVSG